MATTKIKPIKSTVGKAVKYICNPDKTEGGIFIDSFCCTPETAAEEFAMTADQRHRSKDKGTLAYHMIQSFKPGEVSAEEAHAIGKEYADAVLQGNHEYVISTHLDKGHIHNHIIFNAVSYANHKKYNDCTRARYFREKTNDRICREHNLSVIKEKSGKKGYEKYGHADTQKGTSWKAKLKKVIDDFAEKASSFEEFLQMMETAGYEIRREPELAFKSRDGQKYFTKVKNIGKSYAEESIKKHILSREEKQNGDKKTSADRKENRSAGRTKKEKSGQISILIDIKNNLKAQQSAAYKNKLVLENINRTLDTVRFLEKNNFATGQELADKINELKENCEIYKNDMRSMEKEMRRLSEQIKYGKDFWKYKKVYEQSKTEAVDSPFWTEENTKKLMLFENAQSYMKKNGLSYKDFAIKTLIGRYNSLRKERNDMYQEYAAARDSLKELEKVKLNIENILGRKIEKEERGQEAPKQKKKRDMDR